MYKLISFTFTLFISTYACAEVRLPRLFGDGMVMQRDQGVPVWGSAGRYEEVTVKFNKNTYTVKADNAGNWRLILRPMPAGGPFRMEVVGKKNSIIVDNILVGDVWLASGQSNMERTLDNFGQVGKVEPEIRHFKIPRSYSSVAESALTGGEWAIAREKTVGGFSAVAYYFAREIHRHVNVPVGLINATWGGSRIEAWMSAGTYRQGKTADILAALKQQQDSESLKQRISLREKLGGLPDVDAGYLDGAPIWAGEEFDDTDWMSIHLPGTWEEVGYEGLDGIIWIRKKITLTAEEAKQPLQLGLGRIDDSDRTWVNGHQVGGMKDSWYVHRVYDVPASILKTGENIVAVRIEDTGGPGGIHGEAELMAISSGTREWTISGDWKFRVGAYIPYSLQKETPNALFNQMISPLTGYPIKGVIWYQGEANANPGDAYLYRDLFSVMIEDWRKKWGLGEIPFLFVQLANFMQANSQPEESDWAMLRESQSSALALPNTMQAVTIDIGEADDIHPHNKQDVGLRLSLGARKLAYGEDIVYSGPAYKSHVINENKVIIRFSHVAGGLILKGQGEQVNEVAIAGSDKKFVWANAVIKGDEMVVWNESISAPVAVCYAWSNNPDKANLYNVAGLPASPFRTDNW